MKNYNLRWLFLLFVLIVSNCTTKEKQETYKTKAITYRVDTNKVIGQSVNFCEFLPLLGSEQHILFEITKLRIMDNRIIIFEKKTHRVLVYQTDGKFLYEINKRGRGDKEYLEIANITVTAKYIYLMDNFKHKMSIYNLKDGTFVKTSKLPFVAWDLEAFDDNNFLFTMLANNPHGKVEAKAQNYAVWRTDSMWKIKNSYIPYDKGYYEMSGKNIYFTVSGKDIIFHSFLKDGYYTFDTKGIREYTSLVFQHPIPHDRPIEYENVIRKNYHYLSETPFVTKDYAATEIGQGDIIEFQLYNDRAKAFFKNSEASCLNAMMNVCGIWRNRFVSFIPDYETYKDLLSCGFKKADNTTEECLKKNGQCLILYSMR